jgi:hypothetical protein
VAKDGPGCALGFRRSLGLFPGPSGRPSMSEPAYGLEAVQRSETDGQRPVRDNGHAKGVPAETNVRGLQGPWHLRIASQFPSHSASTAGVHHRSRSRPGKGVTQRRQAVAGQQQMAAAAAAELESVCGGHFTVGSNPHRYRSEQTRRREPVRSLVGSRRFGPSGGTIRKGTCQVLRTGRAAVNPWWRSVRHSERMSSRHRREGLRTAPDRFLVSAPDQLMTSL